MGTTSRNAKRLVTGALAAMLSLGSVGGLAAVVSQATPAAAGTAYTFGDLFVSVGSGMVEEHTPSGTLVQTLSSGALALRNAGSAFDESGNLYVTEFDGETVSKYDNGGNFLGAFGSGYNSHPESMVFDAAGNAYVGQADGSAQILKFDPAGNALASYSPALENRGTDIDLESDGCTMQYTSEGTSVKQFNVCTNTQLADFATGLPGVAFAHRMLPDGTVLVADTSSVLRLNSSGAVIQTYTPAESPSLLFAMTLGPDGQTFWTADLVSGLVAHFNIATGAELGSFSVGKPIGGITALADTTPPSCVLTGVGFANGHTFIKVTVQDAAPGSGLQSIVVTDHLNATVVVPAFTPGTNNPVVVKATKINQNSLSRLALRVTDVAGNVTTCDPVIATLVPVTSQLITDVPTAEHVLTVINGSPGLRSVTATVNGKKFGVNSLRAGETRNVDIGSALRPGDTNTVKLVGAGSAGSSATVVIWDGIGSIGP